MIFSAAGLRDLGLQMYLTLPCQCQGAGYIVAASNQANGVRRFQLTCSACDRVCGGSIALAKLPPHVREAAPLIANNIDHAAHCTRCGSAANGVELHHWAPFARFDDFDRWPTSMLCPACHHEWHNKMNGYVWQPNLRKSSSR